MIPFKVYIAAPFFNPVQLAFVKRIENLLTENSINFFSPRLEGVVMNFKNMSKDEKHRETKRIYDANIEHINDCDYMIAVIDDHDTGTMFEIGYHSALKATELESAGYSDRKIITTTDNNYGLNIMLMHGVTCHIMGTERLIEVLHALAADEEVESDIPEKLT